MAAIGRKGGAAGKGTAVRKDLAKRAAAARWAARVGARVGDSIDIVSHGSHLIVTPFPNSLLKHLRYYRHSRVEGRSVGEWQDLFLIESPTRLFTDQGLLHNIGSFLQREGYRVRYRRLDPQFADADESAAAIQELQLEQQRDLRRMLRVPGGATLRSSSADTIPIMLALVSAFAKYRGFIVAQERDLVDQLYVELNKIRAPSKLSIGMLTGERADEGDIVVMTAAMLSSRLIRPNDRGFLIFVDPPKKGEVWSSQMVPFFAASKFALCNAAIRYPPWRLKQIEATFGPTVNDRRYKPLSIRVGEDGAQLLAFSQSLAGEPS